MKLPVYMDYQATTPVDPRVFEVMKPYFMTDFGNAASKSHAYGWRAEAAVERARGQVAQLLGADPSEIIFTSGATESNNLAILGVARALKNRGRHLITCQTEHKAVLDPCKRLEEEGFEVTYLSVNREGEVDLQQLQDSLRADTVLLSIMAANNEVGTLAPLQQIGNIARAAGVLFHTDAAQAVGKVPVPVNEVGIDLLSMSAHKIYGPKGIGALYIKKKRPAISLVPLMFGGGHENGLRSGTLNVPGAVGLGEALELAGGEMAEETQRLTQLRDRLWDRLQKNLGGIHLNGSQAHRLPNNLNVRFEHVPSETFMMELKDVAVSSGSACTSAIPKPSHVLRAMGLTEEESKSSIRLGLGRFTTEEEVDYVVRRVQEVVKNIREKSISYGMAQEGIDF